MGIIVGLADCGVNGVGFLWWLGFEGWLGSSGCKWVVFGGARHSWFGLWGRLGLLRGVWVGVHIWRVELN